MTEQERVAEIALSWVGTPYHHMGRIKGVGADCITLIAGVFEEAGITGHIELEPYSPQWNLHGEADELVTIGLLKFCDQVEDTPRTGDVVVYRYGRRFSHNTLVTSWPRIVHCWQKVGVKEGDAIRDGFLRFIGNDNKANAGKDRPFKVFRLKRWNT